MVDAYSFTQEFRIKILSLMLDDSWMAMYGTNIIKSEYFEQENEEIVANGILRYREKFKSSPRDISDLITLCGEEHEDIISDVYECAGDTRLASDLVVEFARAQAAKLAILDSITDVQDGNLEAVMNRLEEAVKVGQNIYNMGIDPYNEPESWIYDQWTSNVRTGLLHVDEVLQGGLSAGELGAILAPPNRGKTMTLINIGYGAASIGSGKNVLHISHEMSAIKIAKRYAARVMFKFPRPEEDLEVYANDLYEKARRLVPGKVKVIDSVGRVMDQNEVRSQISRLEDSGFKIDLIIDDYLDLMTPSRHYGEKRHEIASTWEWFRGYLKELGIPGWTATQGNRSSLSKEIITLKDIAEDISKAATSDVIIALCQTHDEDVANRCRLFMAKVRDGESKGTIDAKFYGAQQAIITTGYAKRKLQVDTDV